MDKHTLSNYGWIVIITLILSVMLAFATPFGNFVGRGVANVSNALIEMASNAVNEDNINTKGEDWESQFTHWNKGDGDGDVTAGLGTGGDPSHNHNYKKYIVKEATCTEDGIAVYACECGASYTEVIKATGCKPSNGICTECGKQIEEVVAGLYQTGTNYGTLLKSWNQLVSEGTIGGISSGLIKCEKKDNLAGDLILSNDSSLTEITGSAFKGCKSLTGIIIQDNIKTIGNSAFEECDGITVLTIPDSVTKMGDRVFFDCDGITNLTIPNSVTEIGSSMFAYCDALVSVQLSKNIPEIKSGTFSNCVSLESIKIPDKVTKIGDSAFYQCTALQKIVLPQTTKEVGDYTFLGTNIQYFDLGGTETIGHQSLSFVYTDFTLVADSLKNIGTNAFYGSEITKFIFPNSVKSVEDYAFKQCTKLETITLNQGLESLDYYTFYNCTNLKEIFIPKTLTTINGNTFSGCSALTKVTIEEGLTLIGMGMFRSSSLKEITIPNTVKTLGEFSFENCTNLETVYFNGTEEEWTTLKNTTRYSQSCLNNANIIYTNN